MDTELDGQRHSDHALDHGHGHGQGHGGVRGAVMSVLKPHSHDAGDSIDDALESSRHGIHALIISLVALLVTALLQAGIAIASGSVALLADTVHNFADAFTAVPLGIAFWLGRRPSNRRYTYGYGRAEDLAGVFIVLVIAASAVYAGWEAVHRLIDPQPVQHIGWVLGAGFIGFTGNELVAVYRIRVGRSIGSAALVADGLHARTDGLTSLAVVGGALGVAAGFPLADPIVGLLISLAILLVLRGAVSDVFGRLMDSVDPALVNAGRQALAQTDGVHDVEDLRLRWSGHRLHADAAITMASSLSVVDADQIVEDAKANLRRALPKLATAVLCPRAKVRSGL